MISANTLARDLRRRADNWRSLARAAGLDASEYRVADAEAERLEEFASQLMHCHMLLEHQWNGEV